MLISVANAYFTNVFSFWRKYELKLGSIIAQYMNVIYSKIIFGKVDHLKVAFEKLREKYQRLTKKRVALLAET
jgi:hypothetical protein